MAGQVLKEDNAIAREMRSADTEQGISNRVGNTETCPPYNKFTYAHFSCPESFNFSSSRLK